MYREIPIAAATATTTTTPADATSRQRILQDRRAQ
jgi:hypothetical protein